MSFRKIYFSILVAVAIVASACVKENEDLVNAPLPSESVSLRLFNLCSDGEERSLLLGYDVETETVGYGALSDAITPPPADSSDAAIIKNGEKEFQLTNKISYARNSNFVVYALPTPYGAENPKALDTLLFMQSFDGLFSDERNAAIKLFNAYPDSTVSFSLNVGCPNGTAIASGFSYRRFNFLPEEIRAAETAFSITKVKDGEVEYSKLFFLTLVEQRQYAVIIYADANGEEQFAILDEGDTSDDPLVPVDFLDPEELASRVRAINLSSETISVEKIGEGGAAEIISENLPSDEIGYFSPVSACRSSALDRFSAIVGTDTTTDAYVSLGVREDYDMVVFDSDTGAAALSAIVEPANFYDTPTSDMAIVRVLHADLNNKLGLDITLGARKADNLKKYTSGETVAGGLDFGNVSGAVLLNPELTPITVFTATEPSFFVAAANYKFEKGKTYLLVVIPDPITGDTELAMISSDDVGTSVEKLRKSALFNLVNLAPDRDFVTITINDGVFGENLIENAQLYFADSFGTALPEGTHTITVEGEEYEFVSDPTLRGLVVAAGDETKVDIFDFSIEPMNAGAGEYKRRFINCCKGVNNLHVRLNNDESYTSDNIPYGIAKAPQSATTERNISFYFEAPSPDGSKIDTLARIDDVPFPFKKNYSIIFGGSVKNSVYTAVIQQEF